VDSDLGVFEQAGGHDLGSTENITTDKDVDVRSI
jgi:hypothetical protein